MTFRPGYALAALAIFLVEVAIALWLHDDWIRPHGGDVLAVVLVYLGLRALTRIDVTSGAATGFAVACLVEWAQWLDLAGRLDLKPNSIAGTMLGASFDWGDIVAYAVGALAVLFAERLRHRLQSA